MENEKTILNRDIENTFSAVLDQLSKLDIETLNQIPFEGSWTAGQTVEHIIICGNGIPDSKTTDPERSYHEKVDGIRELFLNFDVKFKTDPSIAPGPPPHYKEALTQKIKEVKNNLKTAAETKDLEALCMDMELPTFGFLTRYEWLRFILYHTQRHTYQISSMSEFLK